jgi:hypothetical protein
MNRCLILLAIVALTAACAKQGDKGAESQPKQEASSEASHAPAHVVPGSYEDWCGEHGVPESACTRCNPALIPAFKATNDWCVEHGLPESQCLICNPDLKIVRPPKPEGAS